VRNRLRFLLLALGVLIAGVIFVPYFVLRAQAGKEDFKVLAESKIGDFLKARVQIENIRVGFFNQIAFSGLAIDSEQSQESSYRVQIDQVVFRYNLLQLFSRNFNAPSSIVLKMPEISVSNEAFPYALFQHVQFGGGAMISELKLEGGNFRYEIPGVDADLIIRDIQGVLKPTEDRKIRMDFREGVEGLVEGQVHVRGVVDAGQRTHDLELELSSVRFGPTMRLPLRDLVGHMRWENNNLYFDELSTLIHGWKVHFQGRLERFTTQPLLELNWRVGQDDPWAEWHFKADLETGNLQGSLTPRGRRSFPYYGNVRQEGLRFFFEGLRFDETYDGTGWVDFESGDYQFDIEKGNQRLGIDSNLEGMAFHMALKLDHFEVYGLDLVTSARIDVKAVEPQWEKRIWRFDGEFKTDYFILEYVPFDDFQGHFELKPYGIRNFKSSWGEVFQLEGSVGFKQFPPDGKWVLKVNGFDLEDVHEFARKPLPKKLGGLLEGKLKLDGPLDHPEVVGNFTVKEGRLGKLEYDRGIFQFRGFPPYLKLYDSRILKGRTTFPLEGALDLSLANMFHGVRVQRPDAFVIWKGWELNTSDAEQDMEIETSLKMLPTLALKVGAEGEGSALGGAQDREEENYLVAGPKFKF